MDKKKDNMMESDALHVQFARQTVVVGVKQLRKALATSKVKCVYLAKNADPSMTEPIEALCQRNQVDYAWVRSMTDLGNACGIEVGAAAAATLQ